MAPFFSSRAKGCHRTQLGFVPAKLVPDPEETPDPIRPASSGAIEIEFAAGARMRITSAVDASTVKAAVAALADGRTR
jgi:transposase